MKKKNNFRKRVHFLMNFLIFQNLEKNLIINSVFSTKKLIIFIKIFTFISNTYLEKHFKNVSKVFFYLQSFKFKD